MLLQSPGNLPVKVLEEISQQFSDVSLLIIPNFHSDYGCEKMNAEQKFLHHYILYL